MSPRPDAGAERRDWAIEKIVPGGDGMSRLSDGRVAFASGTLPGDVIRPVAVEAKKGHVRAKAWTLVSASAERVTPPCPVVEACGGCDWMAMSRRAQVDQKAALLREALERTGGFSDAPVSISPVGSELRYRSRVRFHVDGGGRIGFYARGSHELVEIPGCLVCRPEIERALALLRKVPKHALAAFSEIDVRVPEDSPAVAVHLMARFPGGAGPATSVIAATLGSECSVSVEGEREPEPLVQRHPLPFGTYLLAGGGVFTQVNWPVNVALVTAVVEGAKARGVSRFLDAYAGAGNFTLPLLAAALTGVSVERDGRAVELAERAAREQGLEEGGFVAGDAARVLPSLVQRRERFDLVLLDPPRSGARHVLADVLALSPRTIACCSCDPVTLARDLRTLAAGGYLLDEVCGFDMFPSTHHLETLAWMSRRAPHAAGS